MADAAEGSDQRLDAKPMKIVFNKNIESSQGSSKKTTAGIKLNIGSKRKQDDLTTSSDEKTSIKSSKESGVRNAFTQGPAGISMALSTKSEKEKSEAPLQKKKGTVLKAFADDSDSEEEEMPKEARMRMRNIGRDTPTSAGPNSYNKGKKGFVNRNKMWDKELKPRIHLEKPPDKS